MTSDQVVAVYNVSGDHRMVLLYENASKWFSPADAYPGLGEKVRGTHIGIPPAHGLRPEVARLSLTNASTGACLKRNDPNGPSDGVSRALNPHEASKGFANAMIDLRNELVDRQSRQACMAALLAPGLSAAIPALRMERSP
ncbi:MAG: hypothetical protein AAF724_07965 [Pseudomonadota bacterium]